MQPFPEELSAGVGPVVPGEDGERCRVHAGRDPVPRTRQTGGSASGPQGAAHPWGTLAEGHDTSIPCADGLVCRGEGPGRPFRAWRTEGA